MAIKTKPSQKKTELRLIVPQDQILRDFTTPTLAAIAGTGGGKTMLGYWCLAVRMEREPGYGWGMAEPTYQMLAKIILNSPDPNRPNLMDFLRRIGHQPKLNKTDKIINTRYGLIYLGSADNPDTMQGAAVKGYWLDEAGQMSLLAYQTAEQRCAFYEGQVLITTTPYNRGWLLTEISDKVGPLIHVETWRSIDNPAFPKRRYEMLKGTMASHRFGMMFEAKFERPEGLIYSFNESKCIIPRFDIPPEWYVYVGMDFGGVNTAALFFAEEPETGKLYAFREYLAGGISASQHVTELERIAEGMTIFTVVGGSASEEQWRREFAAAGWGIQQPQISAVEVGIDRVISQHSKDNLYIFDDLKLYLDEKRGYARLLDESGKPTEKIANKEKYHLLDAERYIISELAMRGAYAFD